MPGDVDLPVEARILEPLGRSVRAVGDGLPPGVIATAPAAAEATRRRLRDCQTSPL